MTEIIRAEEKDIPVILDIYGNARAYMRKHGNPTQWKDTYPGRLQIESDIGRKQLYLITGEEGILCVFVFFIGEEEAYRTIDGNWSENGDYGVIHRIASSGKRSGMAKCAFDWAAQKTGYLRADTHRNNIPMQNALSSYGFRYCGIVHYGADSEGERLAYDCFLYK